MLDESRMRNALLYVLDGLSREESTLHKIFKILWFADISHMRDWGRFITGDTYFKLQFGPVPTLLYDILKGVKEKDARYKNYMAVVSVDDRYVMPLQKPNLDELSESDIEALKKSINENKNLKMEQLTHKSHGHAWNVSEDKKEICLESIFDEIGMPCKERQLILESAAFSRAFSK
jgi:uncharacterized phage-associated protein